MMTLQHDQHTFRVPLTVNFHQTAQGFFQHHADAQKAKQVYLNTLSVQAVQFYLTCFGIKTDLEQSESWNPVLQVLADIADLWVNDIGRLECRPVLPGLESLKISSEVLNDRIGYIFVQLDTALTEAILVGFLPQLEDEKVALTQLRSLDSFPIYLSQLLQSQTQVSPSPAANRIMLRPWLNQMIEEGWTHVDKLITNWQVQEPPLSFRTPLTKLDFKPPTTGIKLGKFLTFGERLREEMFLIVGISPIQDSSSLNITVELYPTGKEAYLPPALQLIVTDEANIPVLQAEGRQSRGLEFQFSGETGERFNVQIRLNQVTLMELFEI